MSETEELIAEAQTTPDARSKRMPDLTNGMPEYLLVDANGFVWREGMNGALSMARINPDNSPVPQPLTRFDPVGRSESKDPTGTGIYLIEVFDPETGAFEQIGATNFSVRIRSTKIATEGKVVFESDDEEYNG